MCFCRVLCRSLSPAPHGEVSGVSMGHRGQRSENKELERAIREIVFKNVFTDRIVKEEVNLNLSDQVTTQLAKLYPKLAEGLPMSAVEDIMPGLVLTDSYGRGAFQE
jgi:hypothetical protein